MKFPQITRVDGISADVIVLREVTKVITLVGRKNLPEIFTHVQPHAHATANLACRFAIARRLVDKGNAPKFEELRASAYLHDVGKYFIAPSVLLKPSALDEEERAAVSLHSVLGATALSKLPGITETIRQTALHHHEHWDGGGYPDALIGRFIPMTARLVAVVDVYTSLRSRRSYKPILTKQEAFNTLTEMAGRELDPDLVGQFVDWIK